MYNWIGYCYDFSIYLLKNAAVKQLEQLAEIPGDMLNKTMVEFADNNLIQFLYGIFQISLFSNACVLGIEFSI